MSDREQIVADLAENLAVKISAAYRQAFQLVDSPEEAFQVASFGLAVAIGRTAGSFAAISGDQGFSPLEVVKVVLEMMQEAKGGAA